MVATACGDTRKTENGVAWDRYVADPTPEHRDLLIDRYLKLLYRNASALTRRIPALENEDAISTGFIGLSQAIDRFEPARGLSFTTFACPRIRGAVLDEVRRQSPLPRPANARRKKMEEAARTVAARTKSRAAGAEIAEEMGVSLQQYWSWRDDAWRGQDVSLDQTTGTLEGDAPRSAADVIPDPEAHGFVEQLERESVHAHVRDAVSRLPARERAAVTAHYFEERPHREVGAILGVSGARACEIVQRGVAMLRDTLGAGSSLQPA